MILIDKSKSVQSIILTLSELTTVASPQYVLEILNDADRDSNRIYLPVISSASTSRFDLFNIDTNVFSAFNPGYYSYAIYQNDTDTTPIETGKLKIQGIQDSLEIISPVRNEVYRIY